MLIHRSCGILMICLVLMVFSSPGCGDKDEELHGWPVLVRLVDEETGRPVAGIKAVMMDPEKNLPVGGVRVSGADGTCNFGELPAGPRCLMVFGGVDYRVQSLPYFNSKSPDPATAGGLGKLTGLDKTPPTPLFEALLRKVAPDSLPRMAGVILDAATGKPLGQVFVSLSPYLTGYQGDTAPSDDVTLSDGGFQVSQIPFAIDAVSLNLFQVVPLRFTRAGYRPLIWSFDPPNGSHNLDITGILLTMEKSSPDDTASLSGRVVRGGIPVAGVAVGLGAVVLTEADKGAVGVPGWSAVTDLDGRYSIGNLPAGSYLLHPGFSLGDGAFFPDQPNNRAWEVESGQNTEVPDLTVLYEIDPWSPAGGLTLGAPPDSLHWSSVPGAATYEPYLDGEALPETTTNAAGIPSSWSPAPGLHFWSVAARNSHGEYIGVTQIQASFRLHP